MQVRYRNFLFHRLYFCFFLVYNLYEHSSKKTCGFYLLCSRKIALITTIILGISIVLFSSNS